MKAERWQEIEQVYHAALEREPSQRAAFLEEACRGDEALRQEVESLLAQQSEAEEFIETPAAQMLAEAQGQSLLGQQIGSYKVLSLLGCGGMGQVYRARDAKLGREVALKVLPREFSSDQDRVRRFEQEARAASALNHPNIITVHEIGQAGSVHYMLMELVDGKTLREVLGSGPLPTKRILQLCTQVADGLAKAHAAGITHRDLKPENLMITKDGVVKILDFGLAKQTRLVRGGEEGTEIATVADVTEPGMLLGTVGYMSPEQAQGQVVNFQSDQFSLGTIVYEMVTGERAFARSTAAETLAAIIREEPKRIAELNPRAPAQLRWVIERCLAKDAEDRYASTRDLARELQLLRDRLSEVDRSEGALPVTAPSAGMRRWRVLAGIGLAVAVLAVLTGALFLRRSLDLPLPTFQQLTFRHGTITGARFAPDGQTIVYGAAWAGKPSELYTTRPESPGSRSLGLQHAGIFSISSSGEMAIGLGCTLNWGQCLGTLAQVPLTGGAPRSIMDNVHYADWAPDGKSLAVARGTGGRWRLEYPLGKVLYEAPGWISHPRVSPKGDLIAFLDHPILADLGGSVCVVDLAGKKRTLSTGWKGVFGLVWSASGDEIWFTGSQVSKAAGNLHGVTLLGQERVIFKLPGMLVLEDISRDGRTVLLLRLSPRAAMISLTPSTSKKEQDLAWFDYSTVADLSADGRTLLFYEWGTGVRGILTVYLRKTDGSDAVRLGEGKPLGLSPDAKWALVLQETSPPQLTLLPTGTGEQRLLPRGPIHEYLHWAAWSPDGSKIFFLGAEEGHRPRTYVQEFGGGLPRPITDEGMYGGLISPDGKLLAGIDRYGEFYLCPVEGGEPRAIEGYIEGDRLLQWSADGRSLFLRGAEDLVLKIYKLDLASGRRELWKELTPPDPAALINIGVDPGQVRLTPDGKSYVYTCWFVPSELYLAQALK
jgi:eukaryotic-like serine/threonine-protein kinase